MLDPFQLVFVQRGLLEIAALSIAAGLIGTWIVLRGLAFYAHAVGTAAFPGLVLADGLGFSPHLGAGGTALGVAGSVAWLSRRERDRYDVVTALVLVAALALGVILASDVFHSGSNVETLLFGSILVIDSGDVWFAAVASGVVLAATLAFEQRWLIAGFDIGVARALGVRSAVSDAVLIALVAFVAVAALSAVGALLATALLVVPAATTRLVCSRLRPWQVATVALVFAEGALGLWLSVKTNAPPGATIAVIGGGLFTLTACWRALARGRRTAVAAATALVVALAVAGCGSSGGGGDSIKVVATTTQLGDIARVVGGGDADVTQILKPNTDPHEYEPRPRDVQDTAGAKLVLVSGDNLDKWMSKVVSEAGGHPTTVDVGASVPAKLPGVSSGPEASRYDAHWWHDPVNAEAAAITIRDALARANPAAKAAYERNASAYVKRIRSLDSGIRACFAAVPASERKLVTDHDAFNYFARRYRIRVIGAVIPSQTTQAQASAGEVAKLTSLIRRENVRAVFPESSINPKLAEAIARDTGASSNHTLYGDTLGPKGSKGSTYLGMEGANANEMVRGFTGGRRGCTLPRS